MVDTPHETNVNPQYPLGTKPCRVCAEPIRENALKCIHCDSDQNWLYFRLGFSNTVLNLLLALISVLTVAVPIIKDAVTTNNSELVFSYQGSNSNALSVLVSNLGVRPGSIHDFGVIVYPSVNKQLSITRLGGSPATVVGPGTSILLSLVRNGDMLPVDVPDDENCTIEFVTTEPPRVCRRLQLLRDWSHDKRIDNSEILAGGA